MFRYGLTAMVLAVIGILSGCDEGGGNMYVPDTYYSDTYINCKTEWVANDSLRIKVTIQPGAVDTPEEGEHRDVFPSEVRIYSGPTAAGPWTLIHSDSTWPVEEVVHVVHVENGGSLQYFYFETDNVMITDRRYGQENEFKGPIIATNRPLAGPRTWRYDPDINGSLALPCPLNGAAFLDDDGRTMIFNDAGNLWWLDISNGRSMRSESIERRTYASITRYKDRIIKYGVSLSIYDEQTMNLIQDFDVRFSFREDETHFVAVQDNGQTRIRYNIETGEEDTSTHSTMEFDRNRSVVKAPFGNEFIGIEDYFSPNTGQPINYRHWYVLNTMLRPLYSIIPFDEKGLFYRESFRFSSYAIAPPQWISEDLVLLITLWSGSPNWWLYSFSADTYTQLTGWSEDLYPGEGCENYGVVRNYPRAVYSRPSDRIFFFFRQSETSYAVRSIPVP